MAFHPVVVASLLSVKSNSCYFWGKFSSIRNFENYFASSFFRFDRYPFVQLCPLFVQLCPPFVQLRPQLCDCVHYLSNLSTLYAIVSTNTWCPNLLRVTMRCTCNVYAAHIWISTRNIFDLHLFMDIMGISWSVHMGICTMGLKSAAHMI